MNKRLLIVLAIIFAEIVCLTVGTCVVGFAARRSLVQNISTQALEDNRLIATQFGHMVEEMGLDQITPDSVGWNRLQDAVERFSLPNNGFICVTDSKTGQLLCHPKLRRKPGMAKMKPGMKPMSNADRQDPIVKQVNFLTDASGQVVLPDGIHLIAARRLPKLDANVMAHQRMAKIEATAQTHSKPVFKIGFPIAGLVVALSGLSCWFLLKKYESQLEQANSLEDSLNKRSQSLTKTRNATIFGLAKLAENRDSDTGEHLDRIRKYSKLLSEELRETQEEIDDKFIADIGLASALHDIGKVGIPDSILLKPGKLNEEERKIIEQHPAIGCECLLSIEKHLGDDSFLTMATEICLMHHEKWDGSGYPLGVSGETISLSARIVAVADVYDALTSRRPYKNAMPHEKAYEIIMDGSGSHFDPTVVVAFDALFDEIKAIREQHCDVHDFEDIQLQPAEFIESVRQLVPV